MRAFQSPFSWGCLNIWNNFDQQTVTAFSLAYFSSNGTWILDPVSHTVTHTRTRSQQRCVTVSTSGVKFCMNNFTKLVYCEVFL